MEFTEKLKMLMRRKKLNKHTLAQQSGIPYTTIVGLFERGKENARLSTVNRLCDFFGVPLDYLAIDKYDKPEDFVPSNPASSVLASSDDEVHIIMCYRSMNKAGKTAAVAALEGLSATPEFKEDQPSIATA